MTLRTLVQLLTVALFAAAGWGQVMTQLSFKASHNAYERNETIDSQIVNYNSWVIELDISRDTDDSIEVIHACGSNGHEFETELDEMFNAAWMMTERFTFLYLDMKEFRNGFGGVFCNKKWGDASWYMPKIQTDVTAALVRAGLSWSNVYTTTDFAADGREWPSWQTLVARGKYLAVIVDELDDTVTDGYPLMTACSQKTIADQHTNCVLINRQDASDDDAGNGPVKSDHQKYLWRSWQVGGSEETHWNNALAAGFHFIATTKISDTFTNTDVRVHSPAPCYVMNTNLGAQYGTWSFPFITVNQGVNRAFGSTPVKIAPGTYFETGRAFTIPTKLLRSGSSGSVVIR